MSVKKTKKVNVNLGCGTNIVKGWINIDLVPPSNVNKDFLQGSALDIPLANNSVDYILLDQVLEHMAMDNVVPVLWEIRRVLKKGGRCVIVVPDFEDAVNQFLGANLNLSYDPMKFRWFAEVIYGNQAHEGEFHQTPMTPRFMHEALRTAGLHKNTITFWPAFQKIPELPGMRPYAPGATLRNAQLVADIIKQ